MFAIDLIPAGGKVGGVVVGRRRGLLFGVLAVLGLIVAGCGDSDGDQLTTEEFFLEIGVLDKDYHGSGRSSRGRTRGGNGEHSSWG